VPRSKDPPQGFEEDVHLRLALVGAGGDAQPGGAGRDRGGPHRAHVEAFPLEGTGEGHGLCPVADEHRADGRGLGGAAGAVPTAGRMGPGTEWIMPHCQREHLRPGGFGDQIYQAADAGEISHEQAPLLVRSFLSAGVDTTINGLGNALYAIKLTSENLRAAVWNGQDLPGREGMMYA